MYKKNCFAFKQTQSGEVTCTALKHINCDGCKFFKTKEEYRERFSKKLNK